MARAPSPAKARIKIQARVPPKASDSFPDFLPVQPSPDSAGCIHTSPSDFHPTAAHGFCPNLRSFYRLQENRESGWTTLCLLRPASSETEAAPSFRIFLRKGGSFHCPSGSGKSPVSSVRGNPSLRKERARMGHPASEGTSGDLPVSAAKGRRPAFAGADCASWLRPGDGSVTDG